MSERRCWCGNVIEDRGMQCACCRADPPCKHRRQMARVEAATQGLETRTRNAQQSSATSRNSGENVKRPTTDCPEEAHVLEATRQEQLRDRLILNAWKVYRIGQRNAEGTQDPGPSDLYCLKPDVGSLWVEVKRPHGGVMSDEQIEFREWCIAAGVPHVVASQLTDLDPWCTL